MRKKIIPIRKNTRAEKNKTKEAVVRQGLFTENRRPAPKKKNKSESWIYEHSLETFNTLISRYAQNIADLKAKKLSSKQVIAMIEDELELLKRRKQQLIENPSGKPSTVNLLKSVTAPRVGARGIKKIRKKR